MSRVNLEQGEVGECGQGRAGLGAGWSVADAQPGPDRGRTVTGKLEQRAGGAGPALSRATRASHPADGDLNAGSVPSTGHWAGDAGTGFTFITRL